MGFRRVNGIQCRHGGGCHGGRRLSWGSKEGDRNTPNMEVGGKRCNDWFQP